MLSFWVILGFLSDFSLGKCQGSGVVNLRWGSVNSADPVTLQLLRDGKPVFTRQTTPAGNTIVVETFNEEFQDGDVLQLEEVFGIIYLESISFACSGASALLAVNALTDVTLGPPRTNEPGFERIPDAWQQA